MQTNKPLSAVTLILSDARGIYIPRDFICDQDNQIAWEHCKAWGLTEANQDQWDSAAEPDNESYWECWEWILNHARYLDEAGNVYTLHQDGDLWGICVARMTAEEKRNFGFDED